MKDARTSISMTKAEKASFDEVANQKGISFNELALEALSKYVSKEDIQKFETFDQEKKLLQLDILKATRRIKNADAIIKEHTAKHIETFGTLPSKPAKQAIALGAKNNFEPVRSEPQNHTYSKPITQRSFDASQHCTTFQDMMKGHHAKCNHCSYLTSQSRDESQQAVSDIKSHLERNHYSEIWK